jgi:uncharacterized protein YjbI with pentapeptide repeats
MEDEVLARMLEAHCIWLKSDGEQGQQARGEHDFSGKNLTDARLSKARLKKSNFAAANLTNVDLSGSELSGAVFAGATLKKANLSNSNLVEADFENANLTGADFQGAALRRAKFGNAKLGGNTRLREADLRNADLEDVFYLQTAQLAGADVAGAKLPKPIAEFEGLKTIAEATSNAQKLFVAMLGGCLYSWLTIGTTKDAALLTNSASSPLPIIGTALPSVGFYMVAPVVLLAMYFYFHLNMQRLWEALADLPAVFPDGRSLDKRADPWLLNGLVSAHFVRLRRQRPSLSGVQQWLSILLAWWVVPVTLFAFWGRFLPRHDWSGTSLHIGLLALVIGFAWMSYRLARATLRGAPRTSFRWRQAWRDIRTYKRIAGILVVCVVAIIFYFTSFGAINGIPSTTSAELESSYSLQRLVPRLLEHIGFSAFANLFEEDVSTKPASWTGKTEEYLLVKGARLRGANMQYANASSAFLANADLIGANLQDINLGYADLTKANLRLVNLNRADLSGADIKGGILAFAKLAGAKLSRVNLSKARLNYAILWRADLAEANLSGVDLRFADLSGADLKDADLNGAYLSEADLFDADLRGANLSGADFSRAKLFRTNLRGVNLTNVKGLTKSQLDEAEKDEKTRLPSDLP